MSDDFIHQLRNDWRQQDVEVEAIRRGLTRWRFLPHAQLAADLACAVVAVTVGVWFALAALARRDLMLALSALTMLSMTPVIGIVLRARLPALRWRDQSPEGVLRYARVRLASARTAVRMGQWSVFALLALVAVLWACVGLGLTPATTFIAFATALWLASALAAHLWIDWRTRQIAREREQCESLLRDFGLAGEAPGDESA